MTDFLSDGLSSWLGQPTAGSAGTGSSDPVGGADSATPSQRFEPLGYLASPAGGFQDLLSSASGDPWKALLSMFSSPPDASQPRRSVVMNGLGVPSVSDSDQIAGLHQKAQGLESQIRAIRSQGADVSGPQQDLANVYSTLQRLPEEKSKGNGIFFGMSRGANGKNKANALERVA